VSRVHDALRRGGPPATASASRRTAHADAVLTALGYRSARPRVRPAPLIAGVVVISGAALLVWSLLPAAPSAPPMRHVAAVRSHPPATTAPATSAPVTSAPAPKPTPSPRSVNVAAKPADPGPPPPIAPVTKPLEAHPTTTTAPAKRGVDAQAPARQVRKESPRSPDPKPAGPDDFQLALYYQRSGDFEQALMHYKAVLQRDEMSLDAHNNIGNLYMGKGLFADAEREFRRVTAIEPSYVAAHINLSASLYQQKRYDEAAAEARAALRIDPRSEDAYVNLGLAQAAAGQAGDARGSLTRALEIDKHNAAAHYNLALQYEKTGETGLALDHYRQFLQYAGPEQAASFADVRARMQALETKVR